MKARVPLAALSGALVALSFPDFEIWPLAWVAYVPLLAAIDGESLPRSFLLGWIAGIATHLLGFYWIAGLLVRFGGLPWAAAIPLLVLYCAWGGAGMGLTAVLARAASRGEGSPGMLVAFPVALVAGEHLFPAFFPWNLSGGQYRFLPFVQAAEVVGAIGLSGMVAAGSSAAWEAIAMAARRAPSTRRRWAAVAAAVAVLAAIVGGGAIRLVSVDRLRSGAPAIRVGVLQPNIGIHEKGDSKLADNHLLVLKLLSMKAVAEGAEAVIWPETSYPRQVSRHEAAHRGTATEVTSGIGVPVLFGAVSYDGGDRWNSAFVAVPGEPLSAPADKKHLVLGSERIPGKRLATPEMRRKIRFLSGGFEQGEGPGILAWGSVRAGVLNCLEDTIPSRAREETAAGANLLVNITNDAWFGDTSEPTEHLALATIRAVENRRDLVRSVNTGVSALVEATGRIAWRTGTFTRTSVVAHARLLEARTFYTLAGDWVGWASSLALAVVILFNTMRQRRSKRQ